ncbi:MAG: TrkA C-terminal domain-containing protein [Haloferacaceae archaeon]
MDIYETDLPGVGKKHEIDLGGGRRLVIVTHNTGKREVFLRPEENADSEKLFELTDRLARTVGTVLEGAYFQPIESESVETALGEDTLIEWFGVDDGSPLVGETLESAHVGRRTGASIIAIQRDEETIGGPGPDQEIRAGDTLVVIGGRDDCEAFEELLTGGDPDVDVDSGTPEETREGE